MNPTNPFDVAFKQLDDANRLVAQEARIKHLEAQLETYQQPGQRIPVAIAEQAVKEMQKRIDVLTHAGNAMHTFMHMYAEDVGLDNDWDEAQLDWENAVKRVNE